MKYLKNTKNKVRRKLTKLSILIQKEKELLEQYSTILGESQRHYKYSYAMYSELEWPIIQKVLTELEEVNKDICNQLETHMKVRRDGKISSILNLHTEGEGIC